MTDDISAMNNVPLIIKMMIKACEKGMRAISRDIIELEKLQSSSKSIRNFVSNIDIKVEDIIVEELRRIRPEYGFLLEEGGEHEAKVRDGKKSCYRWIIDPIDGSSNLFHANPNFAVSVALQKYTHEEGDVNSKSKKKLGLTGIKIVDNDQYCLEDIVAGVIYCPMTYEIYWAEKNRGAFHINRNDYETRLRVSDRDNFDDLLISTLLHNGALNKLVNNNSAHNNPLNNYNKIFNIFNNSYAKFRVSGSIALDIIMLASGKVDMIAYSSVMLWDIAAGYLIASEAGASCQFSEDVIEMRGDDSKIMPSIQTNKGQNSQQNNKISNFIMCNSKLMSKLKI